MPSAAVVIDDWKNETIVLLDAVGGNGDGIESTDIITNTFLLIFVLLFILLALAFCTIFRPLLAVGQPHRVRPVAQPEIVLDGYYFVRDFSANSSNEIRIIHL